MKKISFLALHLGYGGIEKAITTLANNLSSDYQVEIVSTYELYDKPAFDIDSKVKVTYLKKGLKPNKDKVIYAFKHFKIFSLIKEVFNSFNILRLRKKLMVDYIKNSDSDIIISARDIHNFWLGKYGSDKALKIAWEHNHHHGNMKYAKKIARSIKNVDYAVFVSESLRKFYSSYSSTKCVYIPNMLPSQSNVVSDLKDNNIISVGRLSKEKGHSDLIDVFKLVHDKNNNIKLNIVGDGEEKENIENKIKELDLTDSVIMHGFRDSKYIENLLLESSLFVMTSYTESFGIVLIESMNFGVPVIAFDSAEGARDLIDGKNGVLIKNRNFEEMADYIIKIMDDRDYRIKMGKYGKDFSLKYSPKNITEKWLKLFER